MVTTQVILKLMQFGKIMEIATKVLDIVAPKKFMPDLVNVVHFGGSVVIVRCFPVMAIDGNNIGLVHVVQVSTYLT
jgi:hypothetical protein